jgi:hypothetical protein
MGYLTETLVRFCTNSSNYNRYTENKAKYDWIASEWVGEEDISKTAFHALLKHMEHESSAPPSVAALSDWVLRNPRHIAEFQQAVGLIEELVGLKADEELVNTGDDALFSSLWNDAEMGFRQSVDKNTNSIRFGRTAIRVKGHKEPQSGVQVAEQYRKDKLASLEAILSPAEPDVYKIDTDDMEWLGVSTEDDSSYTFYAQKASQVQMEEMSWLWPEKVPSGTLVIISGKPDCGKTVCLLDWTARVTTGSEWPDGSLNTQGPRKVMLCSAEDDPARTTVPRLRAAGANLDNVIIPHITVRTRDSNNTINGRLNIKRDLIMMAKIIQGNPDISVLILDPITSYLGGANLNKDEEIRPLFDKLIQLGQRTGLTILALVHSSKRSDVDAVEKVMGASSVAGASRAVWTFGKDTEDPALYRMGLAKGNIIKKKGGFEYQIVDAEVSIGGKSTTHPRIEWGKETDMTAQDMLQADKDRVKGGDGGSNVATAIIIESVPCSAKLIFDKAEKEGISESSIFRAKKKLGVSSTRSGFGGGVQWYIPGKEGDPVVTKAKMEEFSKTEAFIPDDV